MNIIKLKYSIIILTGLLVLASCSMQKYCPAPDSKLPPHILRNESELDSLALADMEWWEIYTDTILQDLIRKTLANNKDMQAAIAKIRELRYSSRGALAENFPTVDLWIGKRNEILNYYGQAYDPTPEPGLKARIEWEFNLFGASVWQSKEARDRYLSSIEGQRALQMSLIAEVDTAYFELLSLDQQLEIVRRTMETRQESREKAELRFSGGLTSEIPYRQAIVEYASAATLVPEIERQIALKEHEISLLAGEFPSDVERSNTRMRSQFLIDIPVGLPSDLLLRRPDIRQARTELHEAMANAGFYFASRFPSLQINTNVGFEDHSDSWAHIFQSPYAYPIVNFLVPLLHWGRNQSRYKASVEQYLQQKAAYEKTVLTAFKEVNDALVVYNKVTQTSSLLVNLQEAASKYAELAELQYLNGVIGYMDVLDAQRQYFDAQLELVQSVCHEYLALVDLYKALGGGWNEELPEEALTKEQLRKQEKMVKKHLPDSIQARPGLTKEETLRETYREFLGKQATENTEKYIQQDLNPEQKKKADRKERRENRKFDPEKENR